jgi:hypothetical protein
MISKRRLINERSERGLAGKAAGLTMFESHGEVHDVFMTLPFYTNARGGPWAVAPVRRSEILSKGEGSHLLLCQRWGWSVFLLPDAF